MDGNMMADSEELRKWKEYWLKKAMERPTVPISREEALISKFEWKAVNRTRRERGDPKWIPGTYSSAAYIQAINKHARILVNRYMRMYKVDNP